MHDQVIQLAPVPIDLQLQVDPLATVRLSFAGVREALAQPHYNYDPGFPGDAEVSRVVWRVRDRHSGAMLVVWDHLAQKPTPAQTPVWCVWWQDGQGRPGSGRRMAELLIGDVAGGELVELL